MFGLYVTMLFLGICSAKNEIVTKVLFSNSVCSIKVKVHANVETVAARFKQQLSFSLKHRSVSYLLLKLKCIFINHLFLLNINC